MVKGSGKRSYHRKDMNKLNRTALAIGGVSALIILVLMVVSFAR